MKRREIPKFENLFLRHKIIPESVSNIKLKRTADHRMSPAKIEKESAYFPSFSN